MSSLYLHIPFCTHKCPYCDFFSQVRNQQQLNEYVDLLLTNISVLKNKYPQQSPLLTIYFGGGTPSLLSACQVKQILEQIENNFGIDTTAEITLEVNPGTVQQQQLNDYHNAGINRLSIGIQSLNDINLQRLGRQHNSQQAVASVVMARQAGFDNLSLDLMFALPRQTFGELEKELLWLLDLDPEHISIYGLTFEQGTPFEQLKKSGKLDECKEDLYADQYRLIHKKLTSAAYDHYEISNFAKAGRRCHHNQNYWHRKTCLAVGSGAHGFCTEGWGNRWHINPSLEDYKTNILRQEDPSETIETFNHYQAMQEYIYLGLRTCDGINLDHFNHQFETSAEQIFAPAVRQISPSLQSDNQRWYFNFESWLIYDHLISAFF